MEIFIAIAFQLALEFAIRNVQEVHDVNQLVCAEDVDMVGENIITIRT
jgi:hypothetical protein